MPLQFFDDIADETHGGKLADKRETAKEICRRNGRAKAAKKNEGEKYFSFIAFAAFARHLRARIDLDFFRS
jgi:hypothetical protein